MTSPPGTAGRCRAPRWSIPLRLRAPLLAVLLAVPLGLGSGCGEAGRMPPVPVPAPNLGDPDLPTVELSIGPSPANQQPLRLPRGTRFNVIWLAPPHPVPPAPPQPFLVKIGRLRRDGAFIDAQSQMVIESIGTEGELTRYRTAMTVPAEPGAFLLRLQTPAALLAERPLISE